MVNKTPLARVRVSRQRPGAEVEWRGLWIATSLHFTASKLKNVNLQALQYHHHQCHSIDLLCPELHEVVFCVLAIPQTGGCNTLTSSPRTELLDRQVMDCQACHRCHLFHLNPRYSQGRSIATGIQSNLSDEA